MYNIEVKHYGVKLTFEGFISLNEIKSWLDEIKDLVNKLPERYGVLVDMRTMKPLIEEAQIFMEEGQTLFKDHGMARSAVALSSQTVTKQFKRIARETGIYEYEKYIDASTHSDWEEQGVKWLVYKIDPEIGS
jgi:hypothetical protein